MSKLLCIENSYLRECEATVESVDGKDVVLDQTVFYPRGGGQPSDKGLLVSGSEFQILEVRKKEGKIVHTLEREPSFKAGDKVKCVVDWERRHVLMRMHTAAHVLAALMHKRLGAQITGNQLEVEKTRFDFNLPDFDREKFEGIVKLANEELSKDVELKIYALPREEAMKIPDVVKLANALPPSIAQLRIVEIPGIDIQADGGTHVKNLKEVGKIDILKLENKGKDNRRIYFTLI
jgi:misacylated tRNA(Ala) deacylase